MSGIAAIYHRDGKPADPRNLDRMLDSISHRGSHSRFTFVEDNIGLGLNLMITTPEARHERLYRTPDSPYVVAADARIDNRNEVIEACSVPCRPVNEIPDSELILAAYIKWGEDCPKHLLGDFAFAIWDRVKKRLFVARDHLGMKPVLYRQCGQTITLASEVKSLLTERDSRPPLNEARIADFLQDLESSENRSTFYLDTHKLPAGHMLTAGSVGLTVRRYWSAAESPSISGQDSTILEQFRAVFLDAVARRLRTATPVGCMLSGGVDSSSIVCAAQKRSPEPGLAALRAFSGVADPDTACPESPFIESIRTATGLDTTLVAADQMPSLARVANQFMDSSDDPFDYQMIAIPLAIYSCASESGYPVILDGVGGDIVATVDPGAACMLGGEGRLTALIQTGMVWRSLGGPTQTGFRNALIDVSALARRFFVPRPVRPFLRWVRDLRRSPPSSALINQNLLRSVRLANQVKDSFTGHADLHTALEYHARSVDSPMLAVANDRYDRIASFFGIEPRRPFLDRQLVEFCVGLPRRMKVRHGWHKWILRSSMAGIVPDKVRWRQDIGTLGFRFHYMLRRATRHSDLEEIRDSMSLLKPYVNVEKLQRSILHHPETPAALLDVIRILALVNWLKRN